MAAVIKAPVGWYAIFRQFDDVAAATAYALRQCDNAGAVTAYAPDSRTRALGSEGVALRKTGSQAAHREVRKFRRLLAPDRREGLRQSRGTVWWTRP